MNQDRHPLATALHQCHQNGSDRTKDRVREIIELMRKVSQ